MTRFPDLFEALAAPFEGGAEKVRTESGRTYHYITARTAMNRLDTVLGPENWWDEYVAGENSVLCRLTIRLPDGQELTKSDAGGYAGMKDQGDDDKSGHSDAFKRTAVKFGVARYLYRDGVPVFRSAPAREPGADDGPAPAVAPPPVSWPEGPRSEPHGQRTQPHPDHDRPRGEGPARPSTGRALFAWTKEQEQRHEAGLLKYLNSWAKLHDYPARMLDWDAEQVRLAHAEACRKLQALVSNSNGSHG